MSDHVPAWGRESALLRIPDIARVEALSPDWALEGATGSGVRVAVIDSGVDADHPQLHDSVDRDGAVEFQVDGSGTVVMTEGPHGDVFGHGTACAGIIHTLAPEATITSVRVLGPGLKGKAAAFHTGLQWAVENQFDVINLSLGASKRDWALAFHEVCDRAYFGNSFIVTAANNIRRVSFPSLFSAVASVACNTCDDPLHFHYNPDPPTEFLARGINVEVPWIDGGTTVTTGNSFAAPHIAGFAALIRSKHPELQPFLIKAALWACAANVRDTSEPIEAAERRSQHSAMSGRGAWSTHGQAVPLAEEAATVAPIARDPDLVRAQALIPKLTLTEVIGHGSWGAVFAGTADYGEVAVRLVDESLISDSAILQRFAASVRSTAKLDSPHVLPIYELVKNDASLLIVMPRCPSNIACEPVPMEPADACVVGLSLLAGLDDAHRSGVLHGDLNARNALIDSSDRVILSDAGLGASLRTAEQTAQLTPADWATLAPEQILGLATGPYTDTYAVAAVVYEALSGQSIHPLTEDFAEVHARAHEQSPVEPLAAIRATPDSICQVIDKALAPSPADRFGSARDFTEALTSAASQALGSSFVDESRFVLEG